MIHEDFLDGNCTRTENVQFFRTHDKCGFSPDTAQSWLNAVPIRNESSVRLNYAKKIEHASPKLGADPEKLHSAAWSRHVDGFLYPATRRGRHVDRHERTVQAGGHVDRRAETKKKGRHVGASRETKDRRHGPPQQKVAALSAERIAPTAHGQVHPLAQLRGLLKE